VALKRQKKKKEVGFRNVKKEARDTTVNIVSFHDVKMGENTHTHTQTHAHMSVYIKIILEKDIQETSSTD